MGFVWSSLSVGDKITYAAGAGIAEMRTNLDWLDDNVANRTYNGGVNTTLDAGQNTSVNGSNYGSNYPSNFANYGCLSK